ncbi:MULTISPECIES: LacI family DNA-binding transcriptional regulator [unclassified Curtobacterium]|uniref:LacI family DNA-binding transcriptional regulator n=1 Tax=unclassified Curtobacterium TaxID=257496 RepID=UPI0039AF52B0
MSDTAPVRRLRPASMTDVAALAGVSQKTVSRVVNDEPHVTEAVRAKVEAAISELGFRPNAAARSLKSQRSRRVGLITIGTNLYGPTAMLTGVEQACRTHGYSLAVVRTLTATAEELQPAVDSLIGQDVEAIVFSEPVDNQMDQLRMPSGVTVLTLGPPDVADRENTLAVGLDETGAAFAATDHLLALGHETVWHIAGPGNWTSSQRRETGWRAALQDAGVAEHEPVEGDWSPQSGHDAMRALLSRPDVTAVFVANDQMAIGAMSAIQQAGLSVPGDISIVGFDDMPIAAFLPVPLTTIRQDFDEATRLAMHRLFRTLDGHPPAERHRMLPGQLITRATSAPPSPERRHLRPAD